MLLHIDSRALGWLVKALLELSTFESELSSCFPLEPLTLSVDVNTFLASFPKASAGKNLSDCPGKSTPTLPHCALNRKENSSLESGEEVHSLAQSLKALTSPCQKLSRLKKFFRLLDCRQPVFLPTVCAVLKLNAARS